MIQDMSTTYGYTKQVESNQQGSKHTRAISPKKGTYVRRLTKPASLVHEHMFIGHRTYVHRPSNICSPKSPLFDCVDVGRNHVIVELSDRSEMNTEYGYRKQVESHHQGSKHTLAILMSKLRSSLGAAWEQPGSSLEYAYSMLMTTFLRPFSSKRAELERRLASDEITARPSRDYGSSVTILRLVVSMLLLLIVGSGNVWGQVTYQYYAIHNKDKGYLKQVNGGVAVDNTFRYENSHDANGSSIWVLSSDGYLQQEMYYLNVANDQTLYLSTEKVTQWNTATEGDKTYLKPSGSTKFLCADSGPQLKAEPSNKLNACAMTIAENGTKWEGPKDVSFTVQSPQLVTYLRTYYVRSIIATILKDDAGNTNSKVVDKKDSRCYQYLTYKSGGSNKGTNWDISSDGIIYNKKTSDQKVKSTYTLTSLDPIALSAHAAVDKEVELTIKPQPITISPDAPNYILYSIKAGDNDRYPYDDGIAVDGVLKPDGKGGTTNNSLLTDPANEGGNPQISWKITMDDEGFYYFQNVNTSAYLYFDETPHASSDYGTVKVGASTLPTGDEANKYRFRLYQTTNTDYGKCYQIIPYSKQFAVFTNGGVLSGAMVALNNNDYKKETKVISLYKADGNSQWCIYKYEAEYRVRADFTFSGPTTATATGEYEFTSSDGWYGKYIKESPKNGGAQKGLLINGTYNTDKINYIWTIIGLDDYVYHDGWTAREGGYGITNVNNKKQKFNVTSLPVSSASGVVMLQLRGGTNSETYAWSSKKTVAFTIMGDGTVSFTSITSLSEINASNGVYKLSDSEGSNFAYSDTNKPTVTTFSGILDGNGQTITGLDAPLFTTLTNGTVRNVNLSGVNISSYSGLTGSIAGTANGGSRIYNVGILDGEVGSSNDCCGGLVGKLDGSARVINCFSYAKITGGTTVGGIVGYNNYKTTANDLRTMVMNCMFYGDITGGSTISPVYGGENIDNLNPGGLATYNYYADSQLKTKAISDKKYNCTLAMEDRFLVQCELYRLLMNSNKKLAAIYATGNAANADQMAKWVLETADRQIENPKPYPVLRQREQNKKYPSIINIDAEHANQLVLKNGRPKEEDRNKGGKIGSLSVSISGTGENAPEGAGITRNNLDLPRTDKDFGRFNYNYDKVQLPYYNDVGTGNYTHNRVVTGWKIKSVTSGEPGSFNEADEFGGYNFADRNCTNKDVYSVTGRVFSQGAYFDVPYGVTGITIEPYWGVAAYVSDQYYDKVYTPSSNSNYSGQDVEVFGKQVSSNGASVNINGDDQQVYTSIEKARASMEIPTSGKTVYDYAVVLVGNVHQAGPLFGDKDDPTKPTQEGKEQYKTPYTIMSVDLDKDNEPDYSFIFSHYNRQSVSPIRFDFLNMVGTAQAQKPNGTSQLLNVSIFRPLGWFEITNTCSVYITQFEADHGDKEAAPVILLGGMIDQYTSTQQYNISSENYNHRTSYIHVGSNACFNEFGNGTHSDGYYFTHHVPVSVTGGSFNGFYLSGVYRPDAQIQEDDAEGYISGGYFKEMAGAAQQIIAGDVHWQIYEADITNFYGGGINADKPILGDVKVDIINSHVGTYCGGPKFGDMQQNGTTFTTRYSKNKEGTNTDTWSKTIEKDGSVTTEATGCTFDKFFGAGYGGASSFKLKFYDATGPKFNDLIANYNGDRGKYFDGNDKTYKSSYGNKGPGVATDFDYEFFVWSSGSVGARFFVNYTTFSLAQTNNVISTLNKCIINENFYGGGSLGVVSGDASSTLNDCIVKGSVYGGGFSASIPSVPVRNEGFEELPAFNANSGIFKMGKKNGTTDYTWKKGTLEKNKTALDGNEILTNVNLDNLGAVTGNTSLTILGTTEVGHSVYGGGEESGVDGNTEVTVTGGTIGTTGKGGAEYGNVYGGGKGKADDVTAGIVKGSTNVSISGSPTILHNVYGGGAYGSVGTFSYDATTGFPTGWTTTDDRGKCSVSITGGTIGTTGDNNGMVFGSSRGLEGNPSNPNVDKMAWVYDTDVTIGIQNAQSNATPWIKGSVYGGGENGHNFHDAKVTVHSGTIGILEGAEIIDDRGTPGDTSDDISYTGARFPNRGNVYGSGCGTDTYTADSKNYFDFNAGIVRGNTTVLIDGGHVVHNVYGGGAMGSVGTYTFDTNGKPISCADGTGTCTVTVSEGQIGVTGAKMAGYGKGGPDDFGHVFGAGRGEMHDPDQYPNMETCAFFNKTILNISGTAFLTGSVYGGSESGHVLGDTEVNISGGQIGCGKDSSGPFDNAVWADDYIPTGDNMDCASWPFTAPFAPYDPFANEIEPLDKYPNGHSTDGGRLEASDGHTYYGNLFGGGSGSVPYFDETEGISKYLSTAGSVEGKTTINISGGHIITNVYGGCEATNVKGSATITMTGGTVGVPRTVAQIVAHPNTGYIFGAGKGDQRIFFNKETNVDRTFVNIEGGRVYGSIFGGGEDGHVFQNVIVNIGKDGETGPIIGTSGTSYVDGNVFGGGRGFGGEALTAGNIGGSIELNIKSGKILGSVYGGGRLGSVGYGLYLVDEEIEEGGEMIKPYGILRPDDKYDGSYPNPSTQDASAYYDKGRGYITINISGGTIGNDAEYIYNPTTEQKTKIPNTTFDYQNHLQYTKGGNVFTGGMGRLYALDNTTLLPLWPKLGKCKGTTLNMTGGTVKSSIYGGGEIGAVAENATVNVNGGTVGTKVVDPNDATKYYYFGSVFGGGKGSTANVEGISEAGTTGGNVEVNLNQAVASDDSKKGAIVSQVFGCNDMNGSPKGTVTVHVYATQNADKANISTKPTKGTDTYDVMVVYGGGNLAAYEPTDLSTGKAKVIIDGCGLTSVRQVYGGGNAASTPATDVEINGTYEIMELFGGGNGADKLPSGADNPGANVGYKDYHLVEDQYPTKEERVSGDDFAPYRYGTGEATVNIKGGTIHRVFGGSNTKGNVRKTALTMLEEVTDAGVPKCKFEVDEAYGGGKSAPMDAEAQLHMACIPGLQEAYGGAEAADIHDNVTLTITNGTFNRVFGGNNISGTISGKITVNVEETGCRPVVIGELYGGGNLAAYSIYGYNDDGTPKESGENPFDDPEVNVRSFTSIGAVYGGGYGTGAKMIASPTVNINESLGTPDTYPTTGDYDENGFKGKTITLDAGKETEHTVTLPAHTKGKMGAIGDVFGGGNAAEVKGNTIVNIGTLSENTFVSVDDDPATTETDESKKPVLGADIRGNVYGGGNNAEVTGNTNVVIGKKNESQ